MKTLERVSKNYYYTIRGEQKNMSAKNLFLKNYYNSLYKGSDYGYVIQPDIWIQKYI